MSNPDQKLEKNISIFIREDNGYRRELKTEEIKNPSAYVVYEIDPFEYYNKINETDFLLTQGREELIIYRITATNWYYHIDSSYFFRTHFLPLSQQSLATQFQHAYYTIKFLLIFVGVQDYLEEDSITLNFQQMDKTSKLYLYIFQGYELYNNFYYNCVDDKTKHYLFVDYGQLEEQTKYYYRFHELIGSKAKIAEMQIENYDFRNYIYNDLNKFSYFSQGINHMHIIELKCPGDKNKILSNFMINKKRNEKQTVSFGYTDDIIDFPFTFGENCLTISFNTFYIDKLAIEIFIPNEEENKQFKIIHENNEYDIMNDEVFILNATNGNRDDNFTVKSKENVEVFIIITKIVEKEEIIKGNDNYLNVFRGKTYRSLDSFLYFYEIEHGFNTNYYIDLEFQTRYSLKKFCYQVSNLPVPPFNSQNCFMINKGGEKNISLHNIFKHSDNQDYNATEQKYYIVVFNERPEVLISNIYFRTDLSSNSINSFEVGHNYRYTNAFLEKNKDYYFNAVLNNNNLENNINLYILNNLPEKNNQLLFDIKCIKAFEPYLDYIKHYFTDVEENYWYIINNKDFNTNLYHIIYNDTKNEVNEKLIIKIIPKIDLKITLIIDYLKPISNRFISDDIKIINDSFVHQIYQLGLSDISIISKKIMYNKNYNGLKLYARNKSEFEEIEIGSLIAIKHDEFIERYENYNKFLLIIGKKTIPII